MRIGILTDIHEHLEFASKAIESLQNLEVDEIISLGDFCQMEERLKEICELLLKHEIKSVWGNHDFGLCNDVQSGRRKDYPNVVLEFVSTVRSKIKLDNFLFCHVEPWLNPESLQDLWYYEGEPDTDEKRHRVFSDRDWDIAFAGHYHRWLAFTESGRLAWNGEADLELSGQRHFVVIDACMHGSYAVFDTETRILTPMSVCPEEPSMA